MIFKISNMLLSTKLRHNYYSDDKYIKISSIYFPFISNGLFFFCFKKYIFRIIFKLKNI